MLTNVDKCFNLLSNATKCFVMLLPVREQSGNIQQTATNGNNLSQKLVKVIMFRNVAQKKRSAVCRGNLKCFRKIKLIYLIKIHLPQILRLFINLINRILSPFLTTPEPYNLM